MTCSTCLPWYPTNEKQRAIRIANIDRFPHVRSYACPGCGSTDWSTSEKMIKPEPVRAWWWPWPRRAF